MGQLKSLYKESRLDNQHSSLLYKDLQFSYQLLLGATVAAAVAATMATTVATAVAAAIATTVPDTLATSVTLSTAVTLPTAVALSSDSGGGSVPVFGARFAASCCDHGRFTVCVTLAFSSMRSGADCMTFSETESQEPGMKT